MEVFEGRLHFLKKWDLVRTEVLNALNLNTVLLVLSEFRSYSQKKGIDSISSSLYWIHGVFFYLHWLIYYLSMKDYETNYSIPNTSAGNIITFMTYHVL